MSLADAARELDVSPATLRRWVADGLVPMPEGEWTRSSLAHARIVSRLRARGHSMDEIREASRSGRLVYGFMEDLFPPRSPTYSLEEASEKSGLEPALLERIWSALGFSAPSIGEITEEDLQLLRYVAAALEAGFPLVAFLQLVRVYGQSVARIADAEVKLFHLYVHEPLMHDGVDHLEMAEEMQGLARELLPLASPIMDHVHQRFLQHFLDQDVVGHMEVEVDSDGDLDLGRLRVAIAFADLAGYTRLTEEAGEDEAVDIIEHFVEAVADTLPDDARIIKTIGDEVMIVGTDAAALVDWAVAFQREVHERPLPRIGVHVGETLYRDGDYYGREVNQASRVAARAAGGEVLATRPVVDLAPPHLEFRRIGEIRLKGFSEPTEIFAAGAKEG
jgi:adenylate cyclase